MKKNNYKTIKNNMKEIKETGDDWENKISLIKSTKVLINKEKIKLSELKKSLDNFEDFDEEIDFEKLDINEIISKIDKNSLEKKIKNLKYLKLWAQYQKSKVLKKNET